MPLQANNTQLKVKENNTFRKAYELKAKELLAISNRIMKKNNWSQATFYRKLKGEKMTNQETITALSELKNFNT